MAGTLACMAPELFRGATPDAQSDIWSLGVLLYEMATGARPFSGATGFELSGAILHEPPAPWPDRVPQSIRTIARRCLEKNPGERYAEAEDVRRDIGDASFAGPTRIVPRPAAAGARPSFLSRCWRSRIAWAVVVALVLGGGAHQRPAQEEAPVALGASGRPAIAVLNFEATGGTDAAWLSQGIPSMLLTGLAQTNGLDLVSTQRLVEAARQQGASDLKTLEFDKAAQVAKHAGAGAIVTGSVHKNGADIRIDARVEDLASGRILTAQSVRGTDAFALVDQLATRIRDSVGILAAPGIRHTTDVSTSSLDAFRLYSIGVDAFANFRGPEAARALEQAVQIDPAFAEAYLELASVAGFTGEPGKRREYLSKAARHADRLSERRRLLLDAQVARDRGNVAATSRALDELLAKFPDTDSRNDCSAPLVQSVRRISSSRS
jgi:TolB-like protein